MLVAQGRVGDIIDELFNINSEYLGFISSNLAKVCCRIDLKLNNMHTF